MQLGGHECKFPLYQDSYLRLLRFVEKHISLVIFMLRNTNTAIKTEQ